MRRPWSFIKSLPAQDQSRRGRQLFKMFKQFKTFNSHLWFLPRDAEENEKGVTERALERLEPFEPFVRGEGGLT